MCSQPSGWLGSRVILDSKGLSRPARNFLPTIWPRHFWPLSRAPHLLETSLPGTFAGGDVRSGNVKRVAVAVGEGSIAVLDGLSSTVRIIGENDEGSDTPKLVNFRRPMDTSGLIPRLCRHTRFNRRRTDYIRNDLSYSALHRAS
jgi:hypothetical protein